MDISMKKRSDDDLSSCLWDWKDLGRALKEMGRHSSLRVCPIAPADGAFDGDSNSLERWIEFTAEYLGLEVEEKEVFFGNLEAVLGSTLPGLSTLR